jgi:TolA-binding protein
MGGKTNNMNKRNRYINNMPGDVSGNREGNGFDDDLMADSHDAALFDIISEYMKGSIDIEDVKNDPSLSVTKETVNKMISDYNGNISKNRENENFIREIFSGEEQEKQLLEEITLIRKEIKENKLEEITTGWVKEWQEKKPGSGSTDRDSEERRDFITSSINSEANIPLEVMDDGRKKVSRRTLFVRYGSLSAAAVLGVFLMIRTLFPAYNPDKIFNSFYKPFDAVSPVTRSMNNNEADIFSSAIMSYKTGDYYRAAREFSETILKDPSVVSPRFYMGLTQLALKNYDQTIVLLKGVVNDSGENVKDARWYLGLAYLKTGNKPKAAESFEYLAQSDGFYRERAENILRRLK